MMREDFCGNKAKQMERKCQNVYLRFSGGFRLVSYASWACVDDGIRLRLGNFRGFGKLELIRLKGQAIAWLMSWHGAAAHPCVIR